MRFSSLSCLSFCSGFTNDSLDLFGVDIVSRFLTEQRPLFLLRKNSELFNNLESAQLTGAFTEQATNDLSLRCCIFACWFLRFSQLVDDAVRLRGCDKIRSTQETTCESTRLRPLMRSGRLRSRISIVTSPLVVRPATRPVLTSKRRCLSGSKSRSHGSSSNGFSLRKSLGNHFSPKFGLCTLGYFHSVAQNGKSASFISMTYTASKIKIEPLVSQPPVMIGIELFI